LPDTPVYRALVDFCTLYVTFVSSECWVDILLDLDLNELYTLTDEELLPFARKDKSACELLILRYAKLIIIKSELMAAPDLDRDDLRQEGLMGLLKAIASYESGRGAKFSTFAEVCIVNRMRTFCAKTRKDPAAVDIDDVPEDFISQEETPESILINKEFFSELWQAVDTALSDVERRVFILVIGGASYKVTAEKLGISEKSVDNAMQRARRKIRTYLSK